MARLELPPGFDALIAQRLVAPAVRQLTSRVADLARAGAPAAKVWATMEDERVRRSHRRANGQTIPENLRYQVPKVSTGNDVNDVRAGYDLARAPRDPALPVGNRIECRCWSVPVPGLIASHVRAEDVVVAGPRVRGQVSCEFPRIVEAEVGTDQDKAVPFMRDAARQAAASGGR